jgi:hypothetical protein
VQNAAHSQAADNIVLTQAHVLAIHEAIQAQIADNIDLTQAHILIVDDALHSQIATALSLSAGEIITSDSRLIIVKSRNNTLILETRSKIISIIKRKNQISIH